MITPIECSKITLQIAKNKVANAILAIKEIGIAHYYTQQSRIAALQEKEAFLIWPASVDLFEYSAEIIKFFVPKEYQKPIIANLTKKLSLNIQGNGSIYGENIEAFYESSTNLINLNTISIDKLQTKDILIENDLWAISCIVPRGDADKIVKVTLGMGVGIPSITFASNQDFKDQFGLLGIVVSAEKEVINLVVHKSSVTEVMDQIITIGEINTPGKGFIYSYPLGFGVINSKMFYGKQRHLASIEQIISAIDIMRGNSTWRTTEQTTHNKKHKMLTDLCAINIYTDENYYLDTKTAIMPSTTSGKTTSETKLRTLESDSKTILQNITTLITNFDNLEALVKDLNSDKVFENLGLLELKSIENACTYITKSAQ